MSAAIVDGMASEMEAKGVEVEAEASAEETAETKAPKKRAPRKKAEEKAGELSFVIKKGGGFHCRLRMKFFVKEKILWLVNIV